MSLTPGYGETPVPDDELEWLLPSVREIFGDSVTKAEIYDLEQAIQQQVAEELVTAVIDGALTLDQLVTDNFLRELHGRLYRDVWTWAGLIRIRELSIGIAPEQISVQLRSSLDTIRYRWENTSDWTPPRTRHRRARRNRSDTPVCRRQRSIDALAGGPGLCRNAIRRHATAVRLGRR